MSTKQTFLPGNIRPKNFFVPGRRSLFRRACTKVYVTVVFILFLLLTCTQIKAATVFYSAAIGNLGVVGTWWSNTNGSTGTQPTSMTTASCTFHVANGNPGAVTTSVTLPSTSVFVYDNAGTTPQTTYNLSGTFSGKIRVAANITLTVSATPNNIVLSSAAATSTIIYTASGTTQIPLGTYGNLTINSTGTHTAKGDITVAGALSLRAGTFKIPVFALTLNSTVTRTSGVIDATNGSTVWLSGSTHQTVPTGVFFTNVISDFFIDNPAGATITDATFIRDATFLNRGALTVTGGLTVGNWIYLNGGTLAASPIYSIPISINVQGSFTSGNELTGTGSTLADIYFQGASTYTLSRNANFVNLTMEDGSRLNVGTNTLTLNSAPIVGVGDVIDARTGTMAFGGDAYTVPAGMFYTGKVNNLNINSTDTITVTSATTVTGALTLTEGALAATGGLTVGATATTTTVNVAGGTLATTPTYAGIINVNVTGTQTSALELPTTAIGALNVTSGTYTLGVNPSVTGVTVAAGATLAVAAKTLNINGSLSGPGIITTATTGTVNIASPSSLAGTTTIAGNLTLAAPLTVGSNTLSIKDFSGTAANALSVSSGSTVTTTGVLTGSLFFDTANNTLGTLNIAGNATLGNALNMTAGSTAGTVNIIAGTLTTGGNLTLMSDANGTARIAQITGTGVSGNVNIQRFVPGQRGYRLLGHPYTTNQDLTTLGTYFDITGIRGLNNLCTGTNPSVFSYTPGTTPGYTGITVATGTYPAVAAGIAHANGILAFVRGTPGQDCLTSGTTPPSDLAFVTTGTVNAGNITETVPAHGWNLIANPYPSQVDLSRVAGISSLNALKIINPAQQNGEHTYTNGTAYTDLGTTAILPINGAFLAQNGSNADVTITFTEASKTGTAPVANTFKTTGIYPTLQLAVYNGSNFWDNWSLHMKPQAANIAGDDGDLDKISNAQFDIYSLSTDNLHLNMDARDADSIADGAIIPMGIRSVPQTTYTLQVNENSLPANKTVYLHDKYTGTYTELTNGTNYSFNVDANTATQGENRMELLFNNVTTGMNNVTNTQNHVQVVPNPATGNITLSYPPVFAGAKEINIVNAIGQVVRTVSSSDRIVTVDITGLATGVYVVKTTGNGGVVTGRFIKK